MGSVGKGSDLQQQKQRAKLEMSCLPPILLPSGFTSCPNTCACLISDNAALLAVSRQVVFSCVLLIFAVAADVSCSRLIGAGRSRLSAR